MKKLVFILIFAACGGSTSDNSTDSVPATNNTETSVQETTEDTQAQNSTEEEATVEPPQAVQD
jgi:hypothetical protein